MTSLPNSPVGATAHTPRGSQRIVRRKRRKILTFELLDDRSMPAVFSPGFDAALALGPQYADLLAAALRSTPATDTTELVVVDPTVAGWETLVQNLAAEPDRHFSVFVLDPTRDGVEQLTSVLRTMDQVSAVHIFSHGSADAIRLGSTTLSDATLGEFHDKIASWGSHLSANADVLFYACDVAESSPGRQMLQTVADWSGADVAGSSDLTGASAQGGNWTLEFATGSIEATTAITAAGQQAFGGTLAVITVTTTADVANGDTSSIAALLASDGGDGISLREALRAANQTPSADIILLPGGNYLLSSALPRIDDDLTILGDGARSTFIDGQSAVQIFQLAGGITASMSGLTIQNGYGSKAGGISVKGSAVLSLTDARMTGNVGLDTGGALYVQGAIHLNRVLLDNNSAQEGGAIGFHGGGSGNGGTLVNVTISGNTATNGEGGAIYSETGFAITNSTIADNTGQTVGGIYQNGNFSVLVSGTILRNYGKNADSSSSGHGSGGSIDSGDFNIDSDGTAGFHRGHDVVADPVLAPLGNYGGPTDTYALLPGSPAFDPAGSSAGNGTPTFDQRMFARDSIPDIGAYEADQSHPVSAVTDIDGAANQVVENAANGTTVGVTAFASDPDLINTVSYSLTDDAGGRFAIDATTGVVTVANGNQIDRESAATYIIVARATSTDGSYTAQSFAINVLPVNDNLPNITSDGGGSSASITISENTTAVTTVTATDADLPSQTIGYSIVGGADAASFAINSATGVLTFIAPPDFETPTDSNGNNVYFVTVQASDGAGGLATQNLRVTVANVNETTTVGPDLIITAPSGPTSEGGGTATFQVSLAHPPLLLAVTVSFSSSNPSEGIVLTGALTFNSGNWNTPRTVTVQGVDDGFADGTQTFDVQMNISSLDLTYLLGAPSVNFTIDNLDDDQAGIAVSPISGSTTEAGGTASFTIALTAQPTGNVVIPVATSNVQEGTVQVTQITFTTANWNQAQTVVVISANDSVADGSQAYAIVLGPASSSDAAYQGMDPADVGVMNLDDDMAGLIVAPLSGSTAEDGTTATFTVVLGSQPTAPVTIHFTSNDPGEAKVVSGDLTFTAANWNVAQTVTVQGQNDLQADGPQPFVIRADANSADTSYKGMASNVSGINLDDDRVLIQVTALGTTTSESGGSVQLAVVLGSQPTSIVRVPIASLNLGEGRTNVSELIFTPANWDTPQIVRVKGQDDSIADGNASYAVSTGPAISTDPVYSNATAPDVALTNLDNDGAGIFVGPISGALTEAGGTASFVLALDSQPLADVVITVISEDPDEAQPMLGQITFTPANWMTGRVVTLRGVDDSILDGTQQVRIRFKVQSADNAYDGMHIHKLHLTNADDDAPKLTFVPPPSTGGSGTGGSSGGKPTPNPTGPAVTPAVVEALSTTSPSNTPTPRGVQPVSDTRPRDSGIGGSGAAGAEAPKTPRPVRTDEAPTAVPTAEATTPTAPAAPPSNAVATTAPTAPPLVAVPPPAVAAAVATEILVTHLREQTTAQSTLLDDYLDPHTSNTGRTPVVTAMFAATTVVSVSYLLIAGRVFSWMFTVLAARPMWARFDPLQILFAWEEEEKRRREQEESLRSLVQKH